MIRISLDLSRINAKLGRISAAAQKATRPAAQAGAQVFYEGARRRAPVSNKPHSTKGKKQTYQPGNLRGAIYQAHMPEQSGEGVDKYRVSYNKKKAFYGGFVERGTSKMPAKPFMRPTYEHDLEHAMAAAKREFEQHVGQELA